LSIYAFSDTRPRGGRKGMEMTREEYAKEAERFAQCARDARNIGWIAVAEVCEQVAAEYQRKARA